MNPILQIKEIVIYNTKNEDGRIVEFRRGKVNIITGSSHTGKTALLDIVDYCLGSSSCNVAGGVIRDASEWFAVKFSLTEGELFIARRAPDKGQQTSSKYFINMGKSIRTPKRSELFQTTNLQDVQKRLSNLIGIVPYIPRDKIDIDNTEATIRHAISFVFQPQYVVANPAVLFANTEDNFKQRALIKAFSYFLGAIPNDQLHLESERERLSRDLRRAERRLNEVERIKAQGFEKSKALLYEAKNVGFSVLLDDNLDFPKIIKKLREIENQPLSLDLSGLPEEQITLLDKLQSNHEGLKNQNRNLSQKIDSAKVYQKYANGYDSEIKKQLGRLETINIFENSTSVEFHCPVCNSELPNITKTTQTIKKMIENVHVNLSEVQTERPNLLKYIEDLEQKKEENLQEIRKLQYSINQILEQEKKQKMLKHQNEKKARVIGRINMYLEGVQEAADISPLRKEIIAIKYKMNEIDLKLNPQMKKDKQEFALNKISQYMTELGEKIDLEFSGASLELDIDKLTVKIHISETQILTLPETGSGANWVGYHLITLLALHKYFIEEKCPVPAFLIIDQPSQVYFPPDPADRYRGDIEKIGDYKNKEHDIKSLKAMYELIFEVVEKLEGKLQVIITDHANLKDYEAFQKSIIDEEWRDGKALIPLEWLNN